MAEAVFRSKLLEQSLQNYIEVDSAGTGSWHVGHMPDSRASHAAADRNYDLSMIRARQVHSSDFEKFDYILAMDKENLRDLLALCPLQYQQNISLFLSHAESDYDEVPDPYYSAKDGFNLVLDLVEQASTNLLNTIIQKHKLT